MLETMVIREFACIRCPLGCQLEVAFDHGDNIEDISGYRCQLGREYAAEEAVAPKRMVCAVLCVEGSLEPLSVKTAAPVAKELIFPVLEAISALRLQVPVVSGTILDVDIGGSGVALVATKTLNGD
jgi:CxxC motif-containing protein